MITWWLLAILVVVSYFIGCVNFGKILASKQNVDLSKKGSGNLGATNMFRNLGAKMGYLTLFLDALKGIVSALLGFAVFGGFSDGGVDARIALYTCGLAAILGHDFPIFNKFKGGKGISTTLGVFLVAQPIVTLITFVFLFIYVWFFKYVSMASLLLVTIIVVWENLNPVFGANLAISILTFIIFILAWWCHRGNIERLLSGVERETNIKQKIFKDKKRQQKIDKKQETLEEKASVKNETKLIKQDFKAEKSQLKEEHKAEKKEIVSGVKQSKIELKKEIKLRKSQKKMAVKIAKNKIKKIKK